MTGCARHNFSRTKYLACWHQANKLRIRRRKVEAQHRYLNTHLGKAYEVTKRFRDKHPVGAKLRARKYALMRNYGLTLNDYQQLADLQHGVCAVCGKPPKPGKNLHVDHRHIRGYKKLSSSEKKKMVRGLLCFYCNHRSVGRHTFQTIKPVYEYLKKAEGK